MSWPTVELGAVANVFNGKTPSKADQRTSGHPVLKIRDVSDLGEFRGSVESFVDPTFAAKYPDKLIRVGDSLILNAAHNAAYVGSKAYRADERTSGFLATGEWLMVRGHAGVLEPNYKHHWLTSPATRRRISEIVNGIHLYPKDVAKLILSLPPLYEQRRIAAILDQAEELRAKRRAAIALLDELPQALFLDMFGDPATNPKKWPAVILADVLAGARSGFASGKNVADGVVQIRMNNLTTEGKVTWSKIRRVPAPKKLEGLLLEPGDVLFNSTNSPDLVGKTAVFPGYPEPVTFSNHFLRLRTKAEWLEPKFLAHWLIRQFHAGCFRGLCKQWVNQATVSREALLSLHLPLPPVEFQRQFAARVEAVQRAKAAHQAALAELDALFTSLQHQFFTQEGH